MSRRNFVRHGLTDLIGGSVVLGLGAFSIGQIPGGSTYTRSLTVTAGLLPVAGAALGAGMAVNVLRDFASLGRLKNKRRAF